MKKITYSLLLLAVVYAGVSCSDAPEISNQDDSAIPPAEYSSARTFGEERLCAAMDVLQENMREDPTLARKMQEIEEHTTRFEAVRKSGDVSATTETVITIPVVVNVIYNSAKPQENISNAQIQSQINVLNADFLAANSDVSLTPAVFAPLVGNFSIQFTLSAVNRKSSTKASWGTNDAMKKTAKGGIDPTSPTTKLNIWVCNIGGGILGYAQFPGGKSATDGVVIGPNYFGTSTGTSGFYLSAPYDKGRTATHEIGHWLNLRHIWGDASCGNDQVADTPTQQKSNGGCPAFPHVTCTNGPNGDMFMNYMDYTYDNCMFMFTNGQKTRSRAIFASGGSRHSFAPSLP